MTLVPTDPPGRSSRKARRFSQEMCALRAQGYTFEAIRMALAAVGVHVSNATVQREVASAAQERIVLQTVDSRQVSSGAFPSTAPMHPPASPGTTVQADLRSAKEIAEAFTATQNTNPLFRPRSPE